MNRSEVKEGKYYIDSDDDVFIKLRGSKCRRLFNIANNTLDEVTFDIKLSCDIVEIKEPVLINLIKNNLEMAADIIRSRYYNRYEI